jgi:predicted ester cyclase
MGSMTNEAVRELTATVLGAGEPSDIDAACAEDVRVHDVGRGVEYEDREAFARWAAEFRAAFPDLAVETRGVVVADDTAVARFVARGTQVRAWGEFESADEVVEFEGTVVYRTGDADVREVWLLYDRYGPETERDADALDAGFADVTAGGVGGEGPGSGDDGAGRSDAADDRDEVVERLEALYAEYAPAMTGYVWLSEADRWAEFAFCLANQCGTADAEATRAAVDDLYGQGLLRVSTLAAVDDPAETVAVVAAYTLERYGFTEAESERAVRLLSDVARALQTHADGKQQRFVRQFGEQLRDELVEAADTEAVDEARLRYATTHWLQNAFELPISLQHEAIEAFCERHDVTPEELWRAADEAELNVAVVDDLLNLDRKFAAERPGPDGGG